MQSLVEPVRAALITGVGGSVLTRLLRSTRSELVRGHAVESNLVIPRAPAIYVLWHGRLLPCAFHYRELELGTLISRNRDGDYISRVVEGWGYRVVRGSSSRGGTAAMRRLVELLAAGTPIALTPDGPRGPRQKMKLGALRVAQLAGVPIVPTAAGAVRGAYFGRWDRFLVPAPFTWVPVALGDPVTISRDADEAELEREAERIESRLNDLTDFVDDAARSARR